MPPAPVKDLKIQATESDLVVGTYGRGAFIADVWPLQFYHDSIQNQSMFLFPVQNKPQRNFSERAWWGNYEQTGDNHLFSPNESNGLALYYYLKNTPENMAWIQICDVDYNPLDTLFIEQSSGFHLEYFDTWNTLPGIYRVKLISGEMILEQKAMVKPSPIWPVGKMN